MQAGGDQHCPVPFSRIQSILGMCRDDGYYQSFAPRGEYSYAAAFKKMTSKAQKYLYLEDQFVFYEEALQAPALEPNRSADPNGTGRLSPTHFLMWRQ